MYANLRVPMRVYDVEGGAIFSKNSTIVFFDGAGPRTYGLRPRLWLLHKTIQARLPSVQVPLLDINPKM